jgi:crotonobetainyl-CoA:carnitine CoA-transferase CaiB-like acyl-CoA transferase
MTASETTGPLAGVRVLEVATTRASAIAGMLLADLGADVIADRSASTGFSAAYAPGDPAAPVWDRGKRLAELDRRSLTELAGEADVLLTGATSAQQQGDLDGTFAGRNDGPNRVWMPPYCVEGEWQDLLEDPYLLAGIGGLASRYPSPTSTPVAPVTATTTYAHGVLGAAAAVAGLLGRRQHSVAQHATITGLHACSVQVALVTQTGIDRKVFRSGRSGRTQPNWRIYEGCDGRWFFLAALTPRLFFAALTAIDRLDIMVLPGVDGEFSNLNDEDQGGRVAASALAEHFRTAPAQQWLDILRAADVPCAPAQSRAEWVAGDVVADNEGVVRRQHPVLGEVRMVNVAIRLDRTPARVGELTTPARGPVTWAEPRPPRPGQVATTGAIELPLTGVRVVDASSFQAAPLVAELLAMWGADVVKVEPPAGDPFRAYPMSALVANQHKRSLALDLKNPEAQTVFRNLLIGSDVLVENFRLGRLADMGLAPERLSIENPRLVQCSVSAFGRSETHRDTPAFDPVLQTLGGQAVAQGGDDGPIPTSTPVHDTATGLLGALGVLAALHARNVDGGGQNVRISLAETAVFLQCSELTEYPGRPARVRGGIDYRGPDAGHRYYRCRDGWIGLAARTPVQVDECRRVLSAATAAELPARFEALDVADALRQLAELDLPARRIVSDDEVLDDPFLLANRLDHVVADPHYGRIRVVRSYGDWGTERGLRAARSVQTGEDTREILLEAGLLPGEVDRLVSAGIAHIQSPNI